jgi:steroid delta-isomerase-like uncharacterized protein
VIVTPGGNLMGTDAAVIRRLTDEVFVDGDFTNFDDLVADDFVDHDPMPGLPPTKAGQRQIAEMVVGAFSDRKAAADDYVDTTDGRVVESWLFTARHTGEAMGIPPSGQEVQIRGIEIWRCADGRIVEHWGVVDIGDVIEKAGISAG